MPVRGLETIDGRSLDGLVFCGQAYDLFDRVQAGPQGLEEVRLLTTRRSKKLVEEILPIAMYVQSRYGPGLRLKIKWVGGGQPYDAILHMSGGTVDNTGLPRRQYLEVTTAVHAHDYLSREHFSREGFSFGAKGTSRDPKNRTTVSVPYVCVGDEYRTELVGLISSRIAAKSGKDYPQPISLIVQCCVDRPILDGEWEDIVRALRERVRVHTFREVVIVDPIGRRCTTLYSRVRRRARPPAKPLRPGGTDRGKAVAAPESAVALD
jgi:hypothetical protein